MNCQCNCINMATPLFGCNCDCHKQFYNNKKELEQLKAEQRESRRSYFQRITNQIAAQQEERRQAIADYMGSKEGKE